MKAGQPIPRNVGVSMPSLVAGEQVGAHEALVTALHIAVIDLLGVVW